MRIASMKILFVLLGMTALNLSAHVDDPKERDRQPPYRGPGYLPLLHKKPAMDFPSEGLTLHSWVPLQEFGASISFASDSWGHVSPSGREYAIIALSDACGFVDVTVPGNPTVVATLPSPRSTWRDIKVYDQFAYAVSEGGGGIQVFDMTLIDNGVVSLRNTITTGGLEKTHNVAINTDSGYLYRCGGGDNGLRIYSLADPGNPTFVAEWTDRYVHDAQVVNYTDGPFAGREIAFCSAGFNGGSVMTGLSILDVTDKENITDIAHIQHSSPVYAHQGWLTPDKKYFYMGDELDEISNGTPTRTIIFDVSDLENPVMAGTFETGSTSIDHNIYIKGDLLIESNYRGGLSIFNIANPLTPQRIAYFDTYPADDQSRYNGLWNAYPFFPSGTIIGSDIEKGLFVWRLQEQQAVAEHRLVFPWISNSATFESLLVVQNHGVGAVDVTFTARRGGSGESEVSRVYSIQGHGYLDVKAPDLFPNLGLGAGYSVVMESNSEKITGRWVTSDRFASSPSQGLAVPLSIDNATNDRHGPAIEFGFLPGSNGFQSAPVLIHTGEQAVGIKIYYFDKSGTLVDSELIEDVAPLLPVIPRFIADGDGDIYAVATCSDANLIGVVFVFNEDGQTAIGNASRLENFIPPISQ